MVSLFSHLYPLLSHALFGTPRHNRYITVWWHQAVIALLVSLLLCGIIPLCLPQKYHPLKKAFSRARPSENTPDTPFGLWVGCSTGQLTDRWHRTGLAPHLDIVLTAQDATQNLLVLGGIGSGKTTRFMQPLLLQLLDQGCGGLLFDIKGDVKHAAIQLGNMTQHPVTLIGPHQGPMNLLAGLTPEMAASFLKSAFLLGGTLRGDGFWVDTATELCRNTLGLLSFLPHRYHLNALYRYLFDDSARAAIQADLNPLLVTLAPESQRLLKTYLHYHENVFSTFDEKVKSGVQATVAQALSPFNHPELIDAFCTSSTSEKQPHMAAVLDGTVYLMDLPLSRWGLGAKVAYTFVKLRFFNLMQNRIHHSEWNQKRPVFFMCDEYQELISGNKDGLSDLNFWDKSRSSNTLGGNFCAIGIEFLCGVGRSRYHPCPVAKFSSENVFSHRRSSDPELDGTTRRTSQNSTPNLRAHPG